MSSFEFFDKIYCVHLPEQKERKQLMDAEFEKIGATNRVQYVHATPPKYKQFTMNNMRRNPAGEFGCNLSQIKAVIHAALDGVSRPLFVEDDIQFEPDAEKVLSNAINELMDKWDILYLDGHPRRAPAKKYSKHLAKVTRFCFADAYCIPREKLEEYIDWWLNRISKKEAMYDFILGDFAEKSESYCVYPPICKQRSGYSIIGQKHDEKTYTTKSWDKWLR